MKAQLISLVLATVPMFANASSFQGYCSNAEGTVKSASGHYDNYLELTRYDSKTGKKIAIRDERGLLKVDEVQVIELKNESRESCKDGFGVSSNETIRSVKVRITKQNGGLFDKDIMGVSTDRKTVEDFLVCEQFISGMSPCAK